MFKKYTIAISLFIFITISVALFILVDQGVEEEAEQKQVKNETGSETPGDEELVLQVFKMDLVITSTTTPSGITVHRRRGNKYVNMNVPESPSYEEWILADHPDDGRRILFYHKPRGLPSGIYDMEFSPQGKYVSFDVRYYESGRAYLFDIEKNENIFENYSIQPKKIVWEDQERFVAIPSYYLGIDGSGADALFVSEWGDPSKLRKVFEYDSMEVDPAIEGKNIKNVFIEGDNVYFTVVLKNGDEEDLRYDVEKGELTSD